VVQLEERDGNALISIEDNGKGVGSGAEELHPNSYGIGVIGIKQRAAEYDGQVTLRNTGSGTRVEVKIPLPVPPPQPVVPRFSKLTVRPA